MNWGAESRHQQLWDIRAAGNFIGGGTGCSLLFWAALGMIAGQPYYQAALTGLVFVAAGLFLVWLETGKPWRAFNVFFHPQTSWMTREAIVGLPLFAFGAAAVLFDADLAVLRIALSPLVPALIAAVLGLVFLYCQLRILHSARGLPAWREPRVMPLIGFSGLTEGLGIYLLVSAVLGNVSTVLMSVALVLIIERFFAWRAYVAALTQSAVPKATLTALIAFRRQFLIVGHVLPGLLIILAILWPAFAAPFSAGAGIAAAFGGWWLKIVLVTKAAFMAEFTISIAPARGRPDLTSSTLGHSSFGNTD